MANTPLSLLTVAFANSATRGEADRANATTVAHRLILTYLVKLVHGANPPAGNPTAIDAQIAVMHEAVSKFFSTEDDDKDRERLEAIALAEVDSIMEFARHDAAQ